MKEAKEAVERVAADQTVDAPLVLAAVAAKSSGGSNATILAGIIIAGTIVAVLGLAFGFLPSVMVAWKPTSTPDARTHGNAGATDTVAPEPSPTLGIAKVASSLEARVPALGCSTTRRASRLTVQATSTSPTTKTVACRCSTWPAGSSRNVERRQF